LSLCFRRSRDIHPYRSLILFLRYCTAKVGCGLPGFWTFG
jgi:hypothetical protein